VLLCFLTMYYWYHVIFNNLLKRKIHSPLYGSTIIIRSTFIFYYQYYNSYEKLIYFFLNVIKICLFYKTLYCWLCIKCLPRPMDLYILYITMCKFTYYLLFLNTSLFPLSGVSFYYSSSNTIAIKLLLENWIP
jgi:hypothetical protein